MLNFVLFFSQLFDNGDAVGINKAKKLFDNNR